MKTMYLYLKQSPSGLKYLGVTSKDPYIYKGSGHYWKKHIKKHNLKCEDIATDILLETSDKDIVKFWGMYYSKIWNIVESDVFANLIPESGEFSTLGFKMSLDSRNKISVGNLGKKRSAEQSCNLSKIRLGRKLSDSAKLKIGIANSKRVQSLETKLKIGNSGKKPVLQYDLSMNFIKEWDCAKNAGIDLKINNTNITQCCKNKAKTANGFIWKYKLVFT
jgi:hypothetical protein